MYVGTVAYRAFAEQSSAVRTNPIIAKLLSFVSVFRLVLLFLNFLLVAYLDNTDPIHLHDYNSNPARLRLSK